MTDWQVISTTAERAVLSVLMVLVCFLLLLQTGTRLVGTSAFGWSEEAARYLFIWLVFLGSGFAIRRGGHIVADILRPKSSSRLALAWLIVLESILVVVAFGLLWHGAHLTAISANTSMIGIGLSMGYRSAAVPAGAALMLVFGVLNVVALLQRMGERGDGSGRGGTNPVAPGP